MEVLSGQTFKSKKPSAYKIKKKQAAPTNVEKVPKLDKPSNIQKSQNSSAAINSKRPPPQQILGKLY